MKTLYTSLLLVALVFGSFINNERTGIYPELKDYIRIIRKDIDKIPENRKEQLEEVASYIKSNFSKGEKINLLFICTHNSRRSHMTQIWAQTAAEYYGIEGVYCYSGGTEATAFNARALKALTSAGFRINKISDNREEENVQIKADFKIVEPSKIKNPVYEVAYSEKALSIKAFSKKYNDAFNPKDNFCAVMTCSQADKGCPMVEGASQRVSVPYEDPKKFDDTAGEESAYRESCKQIAVEMFYIFSLISK